MHTSGVVGVASLNVLAYGASAPNGCKVKKKLDTVGAKQSFNYLLMPFRAA